MSSSCELNKDYGQCDRFGVIQSNPRPLGALEHLEKNKYPMQHWFDSLRNPRTVPQIFDLDQFWSNLLKMNRTLCMFR